MKEYIVYDNRTDDVLASGTAKECTKALGYASKDVFYSQICSHAIEGKKAILNETSTLTSMSLVMKD